MAHRARRNWTWYGLAFGIVLFVFGIGSTGMGHGTSLPITIFAAPLSLVSIYGWLSAPVWWAAIGWLLKEQRRNLAIAFLGVHTAAVLRLLLFGTRDEHGYGEWLYFSRTAHVMGPFLWGGLAIYALGLLAAWWLTLAPDTSPTPRAEPTSD
jgi:hypothetical protein